MAEYERHQPEQTLLHEVVRENLEGFLATAREQGAPVNPLRQFFGGEIN